MWNVLVYVQLCLYLTAFLSSYTILYSQDASPFDFATHFNFTNILVRTPQEKMMFKVVHSVHIHAGFLASL